MFNRTFGIQCLTEPYPEAGFGMGFFRDPEIEIFNFGLDRKIHKIPQSRGSGSGFENPEKSQMKNPENPEILEIGIGI